MSAYNASERQAATRCVDCPKCLAKVGEECRGLGDDMATPTHKSRCDKYYTERHSQLATPVELRTKEEM